MVKKIILFFLLFPAIAFGYEDYTTYTETDPGGTVTVAANTITYTNLNRDQKTFISKDMGAGFFSGDFEARVQFKMTSVVTQGWVAPWCVANFNDDYFDGAAGGGDGFYLRFYGTSSGDETFQLAETVAGNTLTDTSIAVALNTDYYIKIVRNEAVGTYGTLYAYIYTNADFTNNLVDTLSLTLREKEDFRYLYAMNTYYNSTSNTCTGYIKNLDAGFRLSGTTKYYENDASGSAQEVLVTNRTTGAIVFAGDSAADGTWKISGISSGVYYDAAIVHPTLGIVNIGDKITGAMTW